MIADLKKVDLFSCPTCKINLFKIKYKPILGTKPMIVDKLELFPSVPQPANGDMYRCFSCGQDLFVPNIKQGTWEAVHEGAK